MMLLGDISFWEWIWDVLKLGISVGFPVGGAIFLYWHTRISEAKLELASYLHGILFEFRDSDENSVSLLIATRKEHWPEIYRRFMRVRYWMLDKSFADEIWKKFQGLEGIDTTNWPEYQKGMKMTFESREDLWNRIQSLLKLT